MKRLNVSKLNYSKIKKKELKIQQGPSCHPWCYFWRVIQEECPWMQPKSVVISSVLFLAAFKHFPWVNEILNGKYFGNFWFAKLNSKSSRHEILPFPPKLFHFNKEEIVFLNLAAAFVFRKENNFFISFQNLSRLLSYFGF